MESSQQLYDNPLTRYKKDLWELCVSMNVFDNIPETKVDKTKELFENIISNYQTQILQQDNDQFLKQKIVTEFNKEVSKLKETTRESLTESKKNQFDLQLEEKQNEFNTMMHKDVPEKPQFQDENEEQPLEQENLDALIQQQMKERESVMNINPEIKNTVVSDNIFSESATSPKQSFPPIASEPPTSETNQRLITIEKNIALQSTILRQIVQSQIAILNKLK